jgi:gliding motility-associated-like protein
MKQLLTTFLFICIGLVSFAQPDVLITDADYTSNGQGDCACSTDFNNGSVQNFHDSGGLAGGYGANENDTITFCPDGTGSKVFIAFGINTGYTLDVDVSDTIFLFDGPDATYPPLDTLNSVITPNGIPATSASWTNQSGCITVVFKSDGAVEGTGWDANVACGNLAQPFYIHMEGYINGVANGANDALNDLNPSDTGYVDICLGDSVMFTATPNFPYEPGGDTAATNGAGYDQTGNHTLEWTFSDGTTSTSNNIWFKPPARVGYFVTLKVQDSYGLFQYLYCKVRVSTIPSFVTCTAEDTLLCLNQETLLFGGVTPADTVGVDGVPSTFPIGGVFAAQTYLPDGSGQNYTTTIDIAGFTPGGTITNATDIDKICISMEHSYLGDLEMMLTCPNGTSVNIFNSYTGTGLYAGGFGGGGTYLGGAYDNNTGNIGVCEEYCFSNGTGALPAWVSGYNTTASTGPSAPGAMVVPGTYNPEETFGNLAGCDINGTWTITVRDNLGVDDGYICEWGIYFVDSLNPNSETYVPEIFDEFWHSDPTIIVDGNNDTTIVIRPDTVGPFGYTFEVLDSYGCSYDTTIFVNVITPASIMPNATACLDEPFAFTSTYAPQGGEWWHDVPGNIDSVTYSPSQTAINPTVTVSMQGGLYTFYFADVQCGDTNSMELFVSGKPKVNLWYEGNAVNEVTICTDDQITLTVQGQDADTYLWNVPGGNADSIIVFSSVPVPNGIDYIMDATGFCGEDSDTITVFVEDCEIPNVITPNSSPGENDVFFTNYATHHNDVNLTIYNRWGRVVYKTGSYDNTWNGVNMNGNSVAAGTYFYTMRWDGGEKDAHGTITVFD